ncbi:5'-nucleotidase C-terminal domain-containing protein, partial [Salmonella sp. SAL4359]|uniref:5'-nucleotidase C-terminal domain-containing protein n=1 Tax=Salmonella sp. SAL4359 TaxID=3159880 RepID=UPI00397866A9
MKILFETALRGETGADIAYYDQSSVAGRLRPGLIRSGDIYSLESWQETTEVVEIRGSTLSASLLAALRERAIEPDST